ncbi:dipeptidase [Metabacillus arenae]|uniref:Dipeptidase n=1 Tax=Metabacillus arenae TaxID=2771434 RepID=A0A926RV44_9BACI|nr:dipeptidase [Metabacillus arenae]MBD1379293.1 dipeptidase [Metabacillus arenae]
MRIFDAHCDVLYKLWSDPNIDPYNDTKLQTTVERLIRNQAKVQCFAVFVPHRVPVGQKLEAALEQIYLLHKKILKVFPEFKLIKRKRDLSELKENEIGIILTLEGCEPIGQNIALLDILYKLGIRSVGLTWNHANLLADGALEERNGGLSNFGKEVVKQLNKYRLWTDLSHLSEKSFWDVIEAANFPIASHSNSYHLCNHPRNLKDNQILALIKSNGMIGLTFVPDFTLASGEVTISHVLQHIDHLLSLGAENHLGIGSDFDGIDSTIKGLEGYHCFPIFIEELLKHYPEELVKNIVYQNFQNAVSF